MKISFTELRKEIAEAVGMPPTSIGSIFVDRTGRNFSWSINGLSWRIYKRALCDARHAKAMLGFPQVPTQKRWNNLMSRLIAEATQL